MSVIIFAHLSAGATLKCPTMIASNSNTKFLWPQKHLIFSYGWNHSLKKGVVDNTHDVVKLWKNSFFRHQNTVIFTENRWIDSAVAIIGYSFVAFQLLRTFHGPFLAFSIDYIRFCFIMHGSERHMRVWRWKTRNSSLKILFVFFN